MKTILLIFLVIWKISITDAQNLVPNPSFEILRDLPVKPNPKRSFTYEPNSGYIPYQKNLNYWFAATKTSPDLRINNQERYNECRRKYKKCDKAHSGLNCVGIITYMGNGKTDTYREYVQVKLTKILRPNIKTYVEFWVEKEREAKLVSNNIGCHFSMKKTTVNTMETLDLVPQVNYDSLINTDQKKWVKIELSFVPETPYKFLLIGNFYRNDKTKVKDFPKYNSSIYIPPYAYYLIDDIRVWQEGDQEEVKPILFEEKEVKTNVPIELNNIEFEFDRAILQASSFEDLDKLVVLLNEHKAIKIAIHGHTDNQGKLRYNLDLSIARARAVMDYLILKGIDANRLSSNGFGEQQPLENNDSEAGRSKNRRVEFLIIADSKQ